MSTHPLRQWLTQRGWTQRQLAALLGVSESLVSRWLRGHRSPSAEQLAALRAAGYSSDLTLNETLAALGYTTAPAGHSRKHVIDAEGVTVYTGRAHEVWAWLREEETP